LGILHLGWRAARSIAALEQIVFAPKTSSGGTNGRNRGPIRKHTTFITGNGTRNLTHFEKALEI
jgi:hypothetical protein